MELEIFLFPNHLFCWPWSKGQYAWEESWHALQKVLGEGVCDDRKCSLHFSLRGNDSRLESSSEKTVAVQALEITFTWPWKLPCYHQWCILFNFSLLFSGEWNLPRWIPGCSHKCRAGPNDHVGVREGKQASGPILRLHLLCNYSPRESHEGLRKRKATDQLVPENCFPCLVCAKCACALLPEADHKCPCCDTGAGLAQACSLNSCPFEFSRN